MIVSKCPLRISLAGGSTDLLEFINHYGYGEVISFPSTLYTYITLNERYDGLYRINYTNTETVRNPDDIKNDIAREVIRYYQLPPVTITFNSDIPSSGSGLASSSSYLVALIAACNEFLKLNLSQFKICKVAHDIELKINPLTGYQDTVGCGIGGLKRIKFTPDNIQFNYFESSILSSNKLYLYPTGITRGSTDILKTIDIHKSYNLLDIVDKLHKSKDDDIWFNYYVNIGWENKKQTSNSIVNTELLELESKLKSDHNIKSMKLCGAGGGGYFLIITEDIIPSAYSINIDNMGVTSWKI